MTGNPYEPDEQRPDAPKVDLGKDSRGAGSYPPPPGPYGTRAPGQPAYGPPGYAPQPYPPSPYGPIAQKENNATTAMVLGIVALGGAPFLCGLTLVMAPIAWVLGHRSKRRIDESGGRLSGRSEANTGFVLGIIGTILLILAVIALVVVIIVAVGSDGRSSGDDDNTYDYNALPAALLPS